MPAYVLALYGHPEDPAEFDAYYETTHVPLALKLPGLKGGGVSMGPVLAMDGTSPFHRVGVLEFASLKEAQDSLATAQGAATAADLANFATGGVTLVMFDAGIPAPRDVGAD